MRQQQLSVTTFLSIEFIPRLENWFLQLYVGMLAPTGMPIDMRITCLTFCPGPAPPLSTC